MLLSLFSESFRCCFNSELSSLAGVLGGHLCGCLYNTDSCALSGGCCETQMCNQKSRSPAMVSYWAYSTTSSPSLALCNPVQSSVTSTVHHTVHLLPRLTLTSQQSLFQALLLPEQVSVAFRGNTILLSGNKSCIVNH